VNKKLNRTSKVSKTQLFFGCLLLLTLSFSSLYFGISVAIEYIHPKQVVLFDFGFFSFTICGGLTILAILLASVSEKTQSMAKKYGKQLLVIFILIMISALIFTLLFTVKYPKFLEKNGYINCDTVTRTVIGTSRYALNEKLCERN